MSDLKQAFLQVCDDATPPKRAYVSLYLNEQGYGGPEEGGWYYTDTTLIAYQLCLTEEEANVKREAAEALAAQSTKDAQDTFNRGCAAQCEWLEARNLDDDYLPEPGGPDTYWVAVEDEPGSCESRGSRHYE